MNEKFFRTKFMLILSFIFSFIYLCNQAYADIITPAFIFIPIWLLLIMIGVDVAFNFFVAIGFFAFINRSALENVLDKKFNYLIAICIITLIGVVIGFAIELFSTKVKASSPLLTFTTRGFISLGQIILFPIVFHLFKLSDWKTSFLVGLGTVLLAFFTGSLLFLYFFPIIKL